MRRTWRPGTRRATFPRELYREAAALGLLGLGYPEALGGTPAPFALRNAVSDDDGAPRRQRRPAWPACSRITSACRRCCGTAARRCSRRDPAGAARREDRRAGHHRAGRRLRRRAASHATARRDGDDWIIDGEKVFITSGMRADWITMAVRTGEQGRERHLDDPRCPATRRASRARKLDKMGWWCSDTAHLRFDRCACRRAT